MKFNFLTITAGLVLMLALSFQTATGQTKKETSLISLAVKEANQPDSHSADDKFLQVTIGKTAYIAELKSGKVVSQKTTRNASGGFSGAYAEISLRLLDGSKQETSQGASRILKLTGNNWKLVAQSESDYQCRDIKTVPKAVLKALKIECN